MDHCKSNQIKSNQIKSNQIKSNQIKSIIKLYILTPFNSLKFWGILQRSLFGLLKVRQRQNTFLLISTIYSLEISKFQTKFRYEFRNLSKLPLEFLFSVKFFKKTAQAKEPGTSRGVTWNESIESMQSCERM